MVYSVGAIKHDCMMEDVLLGLLGVIGYVEVVKSIEMLIDDAYRDKTFGSTASHHFTRRHHTTYLGSSFVSGHGIVNETPLLLSLAML